MKRHVDIVYTGDMETMKSDSFISSHLNGDCVSMETEF